uniref:Uncharacterized protein n=1 Tax=Schizaphis graminum TaxID=13262 RepID=A0A2S2P1E1_SCHGA
MRKLSSPPATNRMEIDILRATVDALFSACPPNIHVLVLPLEPFDTYSAEEIVDVVRRSGNRRTDPASDGLSNLIIGLVHKANPAMLLDTFNVCLQEGMVPACWKEARVVLL